MPTMGALHAGHLSLVERAKAECDVVVVSVFVNPLQFNNTADLEKYPRSLSEDAAMLKTRGVDLLYAPEVADFYEAAPITSFDFGSVSQFLEGEKRPGHFSGVGIVVGRLFHLVEPDRAYFGSKDLQQLAVIKALVKDLAFEIGIVRCDTFREASGLAMSSRNARLSQKGLETASHLHIALKIATAGAHSGDLGNALRLAEQYLANQPGIELEYLSWVNAETMQIIRERGNSPEIAICIAAWVEGVRLIDNMIM